MNPVFQFQTHNPWKPVKTESPFFASPFEATFDPNVSLIYPLQTQIVRPTAPTRVFRWGPVEVHLVEKGERIVNKARLALIRGRIIEHPLHGVALAGVSWDIRKTFCPTPESRRVMAGVSWAARRGHILTHVATRYPSLYRLLAVAYDELLEARKLWIQEGFHLEALAATGDNFRFWGLDSRIVAAALNFAVLMKMKPPTPLKMPGASAKRAFAYYAQIFKAIAFQVQPTPPPKKEVLASLEQLTWGLVDDPESSSRNDGDPHISAITS